MLTRLLTVAAGGFLASAHCIGMCGGFAAAVAQSRRAFWPVFSRQLVYNAGRVFTYAFLGALAGSAGLFVSRVKLGALDLQQVFSMTAGVLMMALGAAALGLFSLPARWSASLGGLLSPLFAYFLNARGWFGYFAAGLANGFLPCGLVYAFLALAIAEGDGLSGSLIMVAFGLGTVPAMLVVGCGARILTPPTRKRVFRFAAACVIVLGSITIWRAWPSASPCCDHKLET